MRLILITLAIAQHQLLASSEPIPRELSQLKVPPGIYELRRLSDDEVRALNSDRMVTVPGSPRSEDQPSQRTYYVVPGGEDVPETQKTYQPTEYVQKQLRYQETPQSRDVVLSTGPGSSGRYEIRYLSQSGEVPLRNAYPKIPRGQQTYIQAPAPGQQEKSYQAPLAESSNAQDLMKAQAELHAQLIAEGYQVVNEDPNTHVVSVPADGSTIDDYQPEPQAPKYRQEYISEQNVYLSPQDVPVVARKENPTSNAQWSTQSVNERYPSPESSYIPQDQLPELQYDMRKTEQAAIQLPLAYVNGNADTAQIMATRQIFGMIGQ